MLLVSKYLHSILLQYSFGQVHFAVICFQLPFLDYPATINVYGKLFISILMCYNNHQLSCRCRQLKWQILLDSAWFFSKCIYIKFGENSDATRTKTYCDIEKTLNMETLVSYLDINV